MKNIYLVHGHPKDYDTSYVIKAFTTKKKAEEFKTKEKQLSLEVDKLRKEIQLFKSAILNKQCHLSEYKRNCCVKYPREYFVDVKSLPKLFSKDKLVISCFQDGKRVPRPSFDNINIEEIELE